MIGIASTWAFLNNRPFPTYSLENMPDTSFSCRDKILGGYYADADAQCQMFHVCVKVAGVGVQDFRFLCPNGTAFDQDHQICAEWEDVDCDATTLYYSSDNFDLYRIGSGFESKLKKYGEDEETFALQRAETGDARINREHQAVKVNQQKENTFLRKPQSPRKFEDNERDIFKGSSSSNFFNNRNGGKENDEDYDDNVNINQDNDYAQKRKLNRKQNRRPVQQTTQQPQAPKRVRPTTNYNEETRTNRPQPTFKNNFAGSSVAPTTTIRPTTNEERYTAAPRPRNNHRHRAQIPERQYNNAENFRQSTPTPVLTVSTPAPFRQNNKATSKPTTYNYDYQTTTIAYKQNDYQKSTFQPNFRPSTFSGQYKQTERFSSQPLDNQYDIKKTTIKQDNYQNTPQKQNYDIKKTTNTDNYPTTFSPKTKAFYNEATTKKFENYPTTFAPKYAPTTFSPKYSQAYNTVAVQKTQYNKNVNNNQQSQDNQYRTQNNNQKNNYNNQNNNYNTQQSNLNTARPQFLQSPQPFSAPKQNYNTNPPQKQNYNTNPPQKQNYNTNPPSTSQFNTKSSFGQSSNAPSNFNNQFTSTKSNNFNQQITQKTTPFTQYTPTIPKITTTAPVRSSRFDETSYDDGSYNPKYDYDGGHEDEFLKTAHSQNIASSRNELSKSNNKKISENQKTRYESPRPFSVSTNTPSQAPFTKSTPPVTSRSNQERQPITTTTTPKPFKKAKDYDYAYYDTNNSEAEYDIDTEIQKAFKKN